MTARSHPSVALGAHPGAALDPGPAALGAGVGPGAWSDRADVPDLTVEGHPKVVPLRVATNFFIEPRDPDPRGMTVVGADGAVAGTVVDVWVDRSEPQVRYLETDVGGRTVLVPITCCVVRPRQRAVTVKAILGAQFAGAPAIAQADRVTLREEDRVMAYFAGGYLYATAARQEPII